MSSPRDLADLRRFYRMSDEQLAANQYDIVRAERRLAELRQERVELIASHDAFGAAIKSAEGRKGTIS